MNQPFGKEIEREIPFLPMTDKFDSSMTVRKDSNDVRSFGSVMGRLRTAYVQPSGPWCTKAPCLLLLQNAWYTEFKLEIMYIFNGYYGLSGDDEIELRRRWRGNSKVNLPERYQIIRRVQFSEIQGQGSFPRLTFLHRFQPTFLPKLAALIWLEHDSSSFNANWSQVSKARAQRSKLFETVGLTKICENCIN